MPRRMSVTPLASQTRTPPGTGIIGAPEPPAPAPAPNRPPPGRRSPASHRPARSPSVPPPAHPPQQHPTAAAPQPPAPSRPAPPACSRNPAPPVEHQVGVHVVAPRHNRHRNPGLVALRYDPALLGIAPATTKGTRAFPPGPRILHCFRHLRSCPLRPWWTPNRCPLPIAQPRLITLIREGGPPRRLTPSHPDCRWSLILFVTPHGLFAPASLEHLRWPHYHPAPARLRHRCARPPPRFPGRRRGRSATSCSAACGRAGGRRPAAGRLAEQRGWRTV